MTWVLFKITFRRITLMIIYLFLWWDVTCLLVYSKHSCIHHIKCDYPHHAINIVQCHSPCAACAGGIAKPAQWHHTHWKIVFMTSVHWLRYSIGTWYDLWLSHGEDNQILFDFMTNLCINILNKTNRHVLKMCSIIISAP